MFSTAIRGGKAFAAEYKIKELKKRIYRLKSLEKRDTVGDTETILKLYEIIRKYLDNMNSLPFRKHSVAPNKIEKKSVEFEQFKEWFDISRIKKISKEVKRHEKYYKKIYNGRYL